MIIQELTWRVYVWVSPLSPQDFLSCHQPLGSKHPKTPRKLTHLLHFIGPIQLAANVFVWLIAHDLAALIAGTAGSIPEHVYSYTQLLLIPVFRVNMSSNHHSRQYQPLQNSLGLSADMQRPSLGPRPYYKDVPDKLATPITPPTIQYKRMHNVHVSRKPIFSE